MRCNRCGNLLMLLNMLIISLALNTHSQIFSMVQSRPLELQFTYPRVSKKLDKEGIESLESIIGYSFTKKQLLVNALTTRARDAKNNYERYEYYGDALLDSNIAKIISMKYPEAQEGELTDIRDILVSQEPLAALCLRLGLHEYIQDTQPQLPISTLADCIEALVGVLAIDGEEPAVSNFVIKFFWPLIQDKSCPMRMSKIICKAARELGYNVDYKWIVNTCILEKSAGTGEVSNPKISQQGRNTKDNVKRLARYLAEREFIKTQLPLKYQDQLVRMAIDHDYEPLKKVAELPIAWKGVLQMNARMQLHALLNKMGLGMPSYNVYEVQYGEEGNSFCCTIENDRGMLDPAVFAPKATKKAAAEFAAKNCYKEMQLRLLLSSSFSCVTDLSIFMKNPHPVTALNLFCQAHEICIPQFEAFYTEKKGTVGIYVVASAPWILTSIKGPSLSGGDKAKEACASRLIAAIVTICNSVMDPKKVHLLSRCRDALNDKCEPIQVLQQICQSLNLLEPDFKTLVYDGPVKDGLFFVTTVFLKDKQAFKTKELIGTKALQKSLAQSFAAKKAIIYLVNKMLSKLEISNLSRF